MGRNASDKPAVPMPARWSSFLDWAFSEADKHKPANEIPHKVKFSEPLGGVGDGWIHERKEVI